jgi:hypothetical protein
MAYENVVSPNSFKATATFASKQFTFVLIDSNGQLATPTAGASAIGVIQDKPGAGDPGAVCRPGDVTKVVAGGTFAAGDKLASDGNGKAVVATSGAYVLGVALMAGAANKIATMIFQPEGTL